MIEKEEMMLKNMISFENAKMRKDTPPNMPSHQQI